MLGGTPFSRAAIAALLLTLSIALAVNPPGTNADVVDELAPSIPEKRGLKYPNLGSYLDQLVAQVEDGDSSAQDAAGEAPMHREESVAVTIYLSGNVDEVVKFLGDNGGDPRNVGEDYIEAYVPVSLLGPVSEHPGVLRVREIIPPENDFGDFTSQGVQAHLSDAWNRAGFSGQGVKVGIIDSGFEGFGSLMGTELPATVQARCYTELGRFTTNLADCEDDEVEGDDHGTIVAETVMDIAPEVSLYIVNGSHYSLGETIDWMISNGVSVINRSLGGGYEGPGDGTSPYPISISRLGVIDRAVEGGIIFLNSAGNNAEVTWFQDGPPSIHDPDGDGYGFIEFAEGDITNSVGYRDSQSGGQQLPEGREIWTYLRWEDTWTWPGASTDLDLYLVDSDSGEIIGRSEDDQLGEEWGFPTESLYLEIPRDGQYHLEVVYRGGNLPEWVQLTAPKVSLLEHRSEGYSINGPSESAKPGMLAVGAAPWYDTGTIEYYSSRGPTLDGRVKPEIVGAACGETALRPLNANRRGFCGTSQASPHVAGLAALVRQRFPELGPVEVAEYLKGHAIQREEPDPNNTWGYGFAVLPPIVLCSNNPGLEADCDALLSARDALAGTGTLNWSADFPIEGWDGVTLGDSPLRVTELRLPDKGLTGEIPAGLGSLASLEDLYLWGNELTGEIPAQLGGLASLEELYLSDNQLSGTIPTQLGSLTNLRELSLTRNQLRGEIPAELAGLTSLEILGLGGNQLTGTIPTWLGSLANLEGLYLWGNELNGTIPVELGSLANLKELVLSENQLSGEIPAELADLTSLEILALDENQLRGPIPVLLDGLANLEELYLGDNQLSGTIPTPLGGLTNLRELSLTRNQLSGEIPAELAGLTSLEILGLGGNQLTGTIPTWLGSLANLEGLYLWGIIKKG